MSKEEPEEVPESGNVVGRGVVSGMRPLSRDTTPAAARASGAHVGSAWGLVAVLAWLLVLAAAIVDTVRASFGVSLFMTGVQVALILAFFMRFRWDRRMNLLIVAVGALFTSLFLVATSVDRREYQPDLETWGAATSGQWHNAGSTRNDR